MKFFVEYDFTILLLLFINLDVTSFGARNSLAPLTIFQNADSPTLREFIIEFITICILIKRLTHK